MLGGLQYWSRYTRSDERDDARLTSDSDTPRRPPAPPLACTPPNGQDGHAEYSCQLGYDHQRRSRCGRRHCLSRSDNSQRHQ